MSSETQTRVGDWQCPNPQCINHTDFPQKFVYGTKVNCPKCGTGKSAQKPGDWCCPNPMCVNHQNTVYGAKMQCTRCGAPRPPLNAKGVAAPNASPMMVGPDPMTGQKGCGGKGGMLAGPGMPSMPRVGDWHCPNTTCKNHQDSVVYGSKMFCPICGADKPAEPAGPPVQAAPPQQAWAQVMPQQFNQFGGGAAGGGGNKPQPRPGDWNCPNETCKNHRDNFVYGNKPNCPMCGTPKPDEVEGPITPMGNAAMYSAPPASQQPNYNFPQYQCNSGAATASPAHPGARPGDWHCPNPSCKNHTDNVVFGSKSHCPMCGELKPSAPPPPPSGGGPQGMFGGGKRPGDWACPNTSCKNHTRGVYASKANCTICGAPNPNGEGRSRSRSPHSAF